jgi:type II secretory ATPase GspE/PulE/Tfp pilus assembly ATPase PilB-like protein
VVDKEPDPHWLRIAGINERDIQGKTLYKPRGCDFCTGTGFRGRIGIFEMMGMNNQLRTMAFERAPTNKIRAAAIAGGMKTLLMDGKLKVLDGKTTAEEVIKVAQIEAAAM